MVLKVDVDGTEITFISADLLAYGLQRVALPDVPQTINQRTADQKRQTTLLMAEVHKQAGTVILACDCNSKETSASHRILNRSMTNAARAAGWVLGGRTLANTQSDTDLQHIDYVFYQGSLRPVQVYSIQDSGGSDHLPILVLFDFDKDSEFVAK